MQCPIMTSAQKEQGHLAKEQKLLREKTSKSEPLANSSPVILARGIYRA